MDKLQRNNDRRSFQNQNHRARQREAVTVKNNKNLHKIAGRSRSRSRSSHSRQPGSVINPFRLELTLPFLLSQDDNNNSGSQYFENSIFTTQEEGRETGPTRRSQRLFHQTAGSKFFTNSGSIIREINEKHRQLELHNRSVLNIRPNWNFNCKLRSSIRPRFRLDGEEKLIERIARFARILDSKSTGNCSAEEEEELVKKPSTAKKHKTDMDDSNPPKKYFVSPSKWVFETPPGRRIDLSKLVDQPTIEPAVLHRGGTANQVFRLDERFTGTGLVERYARNGEVPINENFMNLEGKFSISSFLSEKRPDAAEFDSAMIDLTLDDHDETMDQDCDRGLMLNKKVNPKINIKSVVVIKEANAAAGTSNSSGTGTGANKPNVYLSEHFRSLTCRPSKTCRKRIVQRAPLVDLTNSSQVADMDEQLNVSFTFIEPNDDKYGSARKTDDFDYRKSRKVLFDGDNKRGWEKNFSFEEDYN